MKIFKLNPDPVLIGNFENGLLRIGGNEPIDATEKEVLKHYNRGYYRCGKD